MKATLITDHNYRNKRIYKLSEKIKKGKSDICGEWNISEDMDRFVSDISALWKEIKQNGVEYVAVSDAHTHTERLVFPGFKLPNELSEKYGQQYVFSSFEIAGKHTMIIDGGDPDTIYDDEIYLRFLARLNNLSWEGIEK